MKTTFLTCLIFSIGVLEAKVVKLTKLEPCKDHPESKAEMTDIKIINKDEYQLIRHTINVTEETLMWNKLVIYATRCPSRDNLDFCEKYRNFTIPNIGNLAGVGSTSWGRKMTYTPPLKFPLKPGLYVSEETKVDTVWSVIAAKGYWRNFANILTEGGDMALCVYAEGEIM